MQHEVLNAVNAALGREWWCRTFAAGHERKPCCGVYSGKSSPRHRQRCLGQHQHHSPAQVTCTLPPPEYALYSNIWLNACLCIPRFSKGARDHAVSWECRLCHSVEFLSDTALDNSKLVTCRPAARRCVQVHQCLGLLGQFQESYQRNRRLQLNSDLAPPANFAEGYQPFIAQLTGFFIIEDRVQRRCEALCGGAQVDFENETLFSMRASITS